MAGVPYVFGNATTSIPLSNLDANFNTGLTIGNTTVGLGNTVTTLGNVTIANATTISAAGNVFLATSSGNVGIGTASPAAKLDVSNGAIRLSTAYQVQWFNGATQLGSILTDGSSNLTFQTGSSNTERMRIDSSGNLLVGTTTSASSRLTVDTAATGGLYGLYVTGFGYGVSAGGIFNATATIPSGGNADVLYFAYKGTTAGSVTLTNTGTQTAYVTTSDYRLKENIAPMTSALATVSRLKPVTYKWKSNGSDGQGFIAHELAEVCPDAVTGEKDAVNKDGSIKAQGIDTSFLVATLTCAIQEQQALITTLQEQVTALQAKVGV